MMRHEMRPGLACVPLNPIKTWTWNDQFENDIWYIENCSFVVDIKMVFAVIKEAIVGSDYRVNDTREEYNGDNLYSNGSIMMFEILDAYGLDRDEVPGAFVRGCLSKRKGGPSDEIDINIRKVWIFDEEAGDYVEKIVVDPKLDGVIVDRI
jgi:hypothetical protein